MNGQVDSNLVSHHHHSPRRPMDYATQSMYRPPQDDMLVSPGGLFPDHSRPTFDQDSLDQDTMSYDLFAQNPFSTQRYRTNASSSSSLAHSAFNGEPPFAHHAFGEPSPSTYPATSHSSYDFMQPLQSYNTGNISPLTPVDPVNGLSSLSFNPTGKDYTLDPVIPPVGASAYLHEQTDDQLAHSASNNGYYAPASAHTLQLASSLDRFSAHTNTTTLSNHLLQHHTPQSTELMQLDPYGLGYRTNNSSPTDDSRSSSGLQPDISTHIEPLAQMRLYPADPPKDFKSLMQPYLDQYLRAPNRLALGERTVIVMTSRVAQKSYKTEKRFLCPPPTAILIGNAWWQNTSTPADNDQRLSPPSVTISISGEAPPTQDATVDWTNAVGKSIDISDPPSGTTYIGHGMGKQLFISDADERRKKVEALVTVKAPAMGDEEEGAVIGTFPSRAIKVISKPSKKRQSAKNLELCINHGSIVSLFHRLRSQTVSTKYLCVSGSSSSFKGSDGQSMPGLEQRTKSTSPSFVARTTAWDCFVIYIVDVNINVTADMQPAAPPQPHYPVPPPNAVPLSAQPIYYNQLVVLQCLTSGVVSPVLIIRKIDHQTTVVGGGIQDGAKPISNAYCTPGEVCGDPVSQLHKVAFEVYEPKQSTPTPGTPGISSAFLSCISEKVNTTRPLVDRQWISTLAPPSPVSPIVTSSEYFASAPSSPILPEDPVSNDGGRVRKRRSVSNASIQKTVGKGKRRPSSASSTASGGGRTLSGDGLSASSGALWSVDVGEASCWTIVNVDQVRYNFYIPPIKSLYPIPRSPVTPFPAIVKYLPPDRAAEVPKCSNSARMKPHPQASKLLTVYGENFPKDDSMHVYFGTEPSPFIEIRCTEVLACMPPETPVQHRPMLLVRSDGVIFPSSTTYP